jgi:glutamine amidotransferase-like uncharacterized protein
MKEILIYKDLGVSNYFLPYLEKELNSYFKISFIDRNGILYGNCFKKANILIIPGGRDIYYHEKLNGNGNNQIRYFIQSGGSYLGICAGAYYGCFSIEFAKNTKLKVIADRNLRLVDTKATGPVLNNFFSYENKSAKNIDVYYNFKQSNFSKLEMYYHGGCTFENLKDCDILAYYDFEKKFPAIIYKKFGKGKVLLSGVHFEHPSIGENLTQYSKRKKLILNILQILNQSS